MDRNLQNSTDYSPLWLVAKYLHHWCGSEATMLECNRLRIDVGDGSTVLDYRIEDGSVQSRSLRLRDGKSPVVERDWHLLTPQQLNSLVKANKVVAHWLSRRMGIFKAVRACTDNSLLPDVAEERSRNMAA
jgi:hypothetical protein